MARAKIATVDCGIMAKFKTKFKSSCSKKAPFTENISNLWSKETAGGFFTLEQPPSPGVEFVLLSTHHSFITLT